MNGLIDDVRELARRCPKPAGAWHAFKATILGRFDDLELALEATIGGDVAAGLRGPALAGATERLSSIVIPVGRHPFLDEVVPTLEAMHAALAAVAAMPDAAAEFERRRFPAAA
jgi:hypothetical protein